MITVTLTPVLVVFIAKETAKREERLGERREREISKVPSIMITVTLTPLLVDSKRNSKKKKKGRKIRRERERERDLEGN